MASRYRETKRLGRAAVCGNIFTCVLYLKTRMQRPYFDDFEILVPQCQAFGCAPELDRRGTPLQFPRPRCREHPAGAGMLTSTFD